MFEQVLPAEAFGFFLVFSRMAALFTTAPAFGESQIPQRIRLALALAVSLIVFLTVRETLPAIPGSTLTLAGLVIVEILIGLMVAISARLLLSALNVAGTIIAFQTSLAFSQQFDPTQGTQSAITASFMTMLGIVMIFATDLHHLLLEAMIDSYMFFPVGALPPIGDLSRLIVDLVAASFLLGVQVAAPFLVFGLVFNIGLGLTSRLMPQLPVFFVALPLNISIGFILLLITLPSMMMWFLRVFEDRLMVFVG